jgi:hypothetical protein
LGRLRLTDLVFTLFTAHYGLVHGIGGVWLGVCLFGCSLDRLVSFVYNWLFSFLRGCISSVSGGYYDDEHPTLYSGGIGRVAVVVHLVVCSEEHDNFMVRLLESVRLPSTH